MKRQTIVFKDKNMKLKVSNQGFSFWVNDRVMVDASLVTTDNEIVIRPFWNLKQRQNKRKYQPAIYSIK